MHSYYSNTLPQQRKKTKSDNSLSTLAMEKSFGNLPPFEMLSALIDLPENFMQFIPHHLRLIQQAQFQLNVNKQLTVTKAAQMEASFKKEINTAKQSQQYTQLTELRNNNKALVIQVLDIRNRLYRYLQQFATEKADQRLITAHNESAYACISQQIEESLSKLRLKRSELLRANIDSSGWELSADERDADHKRKAKQVEEGLCQWIQKGGYEDVHEMENRTIKYLKKVRTMTAELEEIIISNAIPE